MRWMLVPVASLTLLALGCSKAEPVSAHEKTSKQASQEDPTGASADASKEATKEIAGQAPKADEAGQFVLTYFNIPGVPLAKSGKRESGM